MGSFHPFRDTSTILVDGVTLLLHLTTSTDPDAMKKTIKSKALDVFSMARRLVTEDKVVYKQPRFTLALDIDFSYNNIPVDQSFFARIFLWMNDVSVFWMSKHGH